MVQPTNKRLVTEASVGGHVATAATEAGPTKTALDAAYGPNAAGMKAAFADSRVGRTYMGRALQPVTDRAPMNIGGVVSNGTDTGANSETYWPLTRNTQSVALAYSNIVDWSGVAATNAITIRASVKVLGGWVPVTFNGRRDAVIDPDGMVISDPVGAPLNAGDLLGVRTRVTVATGEKWPNHTLTDNAKGEGVEVGTATTDKTLTGTITASRTYGPAPWTVLANPGGTRTLIGVGDSIMQQQHDSINTDWSPTSTLSWGFTRRFAYANKIPFINLGVIGDTARDYAALSGRKFAYRRGASADAGAVLVNFGRNDLDQSRTLAQIQADLVTIWTSLTRQGIKVYQTTITPKTTSTDSWATAGGQTVAATESIRVTLNDWIRSTPAPLSGFMDVADTVETARNSGIWKTTGVAQGYTNDGIHPDENGHLLMSAALDLRLAT